MLTSAPGPQRTLRRRRFNPPGPDEVEAPEYSPIIRDIDDPAPGETDPWVRSMARTDDQRVRQKGVIRESSDRVYTEETKAQESSASLHGSLETIDRDEGFTFEGHQGATAARAW
ncbi:MAG TPA: hypothetical protein VM537_23615, partial [Anaerolineae bacterium]|nr:hypothetical protein [Anaerolineae bacterium]